MKPDTDHFCPHPNQARDSAGVAPLQHKRTLLRPLQGKLLITRPETPSPAIQNPISPKLLSNDVSSRFFYMIMPFTPLQKPPSLHRLPCGSNNKESACNAGDPVMQSRYAKQAALEGQVDGQSHVHWVSLENPLNRTHQSMTLGLQALKLSAVPTSFSSVQSLSHVRLFETPGIAIHMASLPITNSQSLVKLLSIESASNHLILCRPLLLPPSIFPNIRVFSNESVLCIRWPKYWSFSFNASPSNEYSGLISFMTDWVDFLAVQETLKNLLQHHSSKASILQCSTFFIVQLSHPYMTSGKTVALTRQTFVGKVMSLVFNMLPRLVIAFLPKNKLLLISWL